MNARPHAETEEVNWVAPEREQIIVRGASWEPMADPDQGRMRATSDGLVFYSSRGPGQQGYHVCLECGRAEPAVGRLVLSLYSTNGLNLQADLATLRDATRVQAEPAASAFWNGPGRTVHGTPKIPSLRMHTTGDNVVPPNIIDSYVQKMQANGGDVSLYRTTIVDRAGHCTFEPSESAAAIETVLTRINTGVWPDVSPAGMNARAKALIPASVPAFVPYEPARANRPQNNPAGGL